MVKTKQKAGFHFRTRQVVFVAFALFALYVIVPQLDQFASAFQATKTADVWMIACAGLAVLGAISSSAAVYVWLAFRPIKYSESLLVQVAGMFVNRLLPAGIGGMGLSADFLYRHGHSLAKASTMVVINNALTFFGHMTLLACSVLFLHASFPDISIPHIQPWMYVTALALVVGCILVLQTKVLKVVQQFLKDLVLSLKLYSKRKRRLLGAFAFAMGNTLGHASAIYLCMHAFGVDLSFAVALIVLTGGVAAASVTPTPGGLVGSEAGLTAVLVGYGVETGTALAIALSYRLVSYWLPLLPGAVALWYAQAKKII